MPQTNVAKPNSKQRVELSFDYGNRIEKLSRFGDGHVEYLMDRAALVSDIKGFAVIAFALAGVTGYIDIRQKVHLDLDQSIALTGLAASATHVKGEPSDLIPAGAGLGGACKEFANRGKESGVGSGIGAGGAADWALININHFIKLLQALDSVMRRRLLPARMQVPCHGGVERVIDECGLA